MPWVRFGDNAATYPKLLMIAGLPGADGRAVNEVRGFLFACATQSGGHTTDYVIDPGTVELFGGARAKKLVGWCVRTGLLTPHDVDGIGHWLLINDPEFIHIRTKAELEWDRQRRADTRDVHLTVPVRLRDGDNCRYCGIQVQWMGRKTNRSAELDHRTPGEPARTPDGLVVACRSCNGARQDNATDWDAKHLLRPVPTRPRYGAVTAAFLADNGHIVAVNLEPDATTAASSADPAPTTERPAAQPPEMSAESAQKSTSVRVPGSDRSGYAGSGRDGSGPVRPGEGQPGTGPGPGAGGRRRRGKRGGRPSAATERGGGIG